MTSIDYWVKVINMMGIQLVSFYIFGKSIHYSLSTVRKLFIVLWCALLTILYFIQPETTFWFIIYATNIIFIWKLTRIKLDTAISAYLLSLGISYSLLYVAMISVGLVFAPVTPFLTAGYSYDAHLDFNTPIYLLFYAFVALFQFLLAYLFFRIKRFRKGFPFLFEKYAIIVALIVAGVVLAFVSLITANMEIVNNRTFFSLAVGVIIAGAGIIIWIRRGIKKHYRKKMEQHSIELLEMELAEQKREVQRLTEQNEIIRVANHKTTHRLAALERSVTGMVERVKISNFSMEISEELAVTLEDIKRLSQNYQSEIGNTKAKQPLPSTKIKMLDNLFEHFLVQCMNNKIDFNLKINGSIPYMVEHVMPQSKLETMIGDHLQDALIAVNASDNSFRSVLAVIGLAGDCYEFAVYDSGIPFDVYTLERLGTERVTTHADAGGSGIGFMTTFETMRECGASLVISEKIPSNSDYSKSVTIRFDGKNQYIIKTYRPDELHRDNRYVVVDL